MPRVATRTPPLLPAAALALGACSLPPPATSFDSPDPQERTRAMLRAVEQDNQNAIPEIIEQLDDSDPAVRMLAIRSLERLTGETLGYDYAAGRMEREPAVQRWVAWWEAREAGS